jgi:propionate CoA-transferase
MAARGERVSVVANYDNFNIVAPLIEAYIAMVQRLSERYYSRVTRYGAVGFLKAKLEDRGA